jgi:hypothetical protein
VVDASASRSSDKNLFKSNLLLFGLLLSLLVVLDLCYLPTNDNECRELPRWRRSGKPTGEKAAPTC